MPNVLHAPTGGEPYPPTYDQLTVDRDNFIQLDRRIQPYNDQHVLLLTGPYCRVVQTGYLRRGPLKSAARHRPKLRQLMLKL